MNITEKIADLLGRILLAALFLPAGLQKIGQYAGTQGYMESSGLPSELLPLVIVAEVLGGLALLVGFQTRWAALALAGFSVAAAAMFHSNFAEPMQQILFMKNLAIAGGLLILFSRGAGLWSLDGRRSASD